MKRRNFFLAVLALHAAAAASAADVTLREKAAPRGPIVTLGDLAEVRAEVDSTAKVLADTPLMAAPAPGSRQHLRAAQVRDLLSASGVNVRELRFAGAQAVTLLTPEAGLPAADSASTATEPSGLRPSDQLADEIVRYLRQQSGYDLWDVRVAVDHRVPALPAAARVIVTGGKAPWTGRQRFTVSWEANAQGVAVSADVARVQMVAVALRQIERGDLVRMTDVELRPQAGNLPLQAAASTDAVVGKEAVQTIRNGSVVLTSQVRAPFVVARGERVAVRARAAGVTVRTYAVAEQDGAMGDLVMVRSVDSKKDRYPARVTGVRELEVFAGGASAADVATFAR
jgi:flagella basal body P-ring formation protein FlgA